MGSMLEESIQTVATNSQVNLEGGLPRGVSCSQELLGTTQGPMVGLKLQ